MEGIKENKRSSAATRGVDFGVHLKTWLYWSTLQVYKIWCFPDKVNYGPNFRSCLLD